MLGSRSVGRWHCSLENVDAANCSWLLRCKSDTVFIEAENPHAVSPAMRRTGPVGAPEQWVLGPPHASYYRRGSRCSPSLHDV